MAVYTAIDEATLRAFLVAFDLGDLKSFTGIAEGVENTNYCIDTAAGRYILTIFEKRVSHDELPYYLGFMTHLQRFGLPCPGVIADRSGSIINKIAGKPAVISEFLQGRALEKIGEQECAEMGAMVGRMHLAGRNYPSKRANSLSLPAWEGLIHACGDRADEVQKGLYAFLDTELKYLRANWPKYLPRGTVHADIFPDNVFFNNGAITGVIDFYFSCWDYLAYDLMLAFNPWCCDGEGVADPARARAFLAAYHAVRPLNKAEIRALPLFGRAAALRIVATRLYDWLNPVDGALVRPKDPLEHVRILKFHQQVEDGASYGFLLS